MTDNQLLHKAKVCKKLRKFYERELKASFMKISKQLLDDSLSMSAIAKELDPRTYEKYPGAVRNISEVKTGLDWNDFERELVTARLTYTYPKYGNM